MPYVFADAETLADGPLAGNGQCVALVRAHTDAPASSTWQEGAKVRGAADIGKGTVIATFVNGRYWILGAYTNCPQADVTTTTTTTTTTTSSTSPPPRVWRQR